MKIEEVDSGWTEKRQGNVVVRVKGKGFGSVILGNDWLGIGQNVEMFITPVRPDEPIRMENCRIVLKPRNGFRP